MYLTNPKFRFRTSADALSKTIIEAYNEYTAACSEQEEQPKTVEDYIKKHCTI